MKLQTLTGGSRGSRVDLRDARGLVAVVADRDPAWRRYTRALHTAFASGGTFRGPGPVASSPDGPVRVGTPRFESLLGPVLARHGMRREEYAAVWYGAGPAGTWLSAAGALLQGAGSGGKGGGRAEGQGAPGADAGALREKAAEVATRAAAAKVAWIRERQDAETRLLLHRDRERELRRRVAAIEKAGDAADCSVCERPLGEHAETVLAARREEWESVVQDGKWWRRRRDQLKRKPGQLASLEREAAALRARIAGAAREGAGADGGAGGGAPGAGQGAGVVERVAASRREAGKGVAASVREEVRSRIHRRVMTLTGGRIAGSFPGLYEEWTGGGRGGGEEITVLRIAARIAMAELAIQGGLEMGAVVIPTGLERLSAEDLSRVLPELAGLGGRIGFVLVKATPSVVASAPECFDLLFRIEDATGAGRVRRQRSGVGTVRLQSD